MCCLGASGSDAMEENGGNAKRGGASEGGARLVLWLLCCFGGVAGWLEMQVSQKGCGCLADERNACTGLTAALMDCIQVRNLRGVRHAASRVRESGNVAWFPLFILKVHSHESTPVEHGMERK
jgi:hypothetical protein